MVQKLSSSQKITQTTMQMTTLTTLTMTPEQVDTITEKQNNIRTIAITSMHEYFILFYNFFVYMNTKFTIDLAVPVLFYNEKMKYLFQDLPRIQLSGHTQLRVVQPAVVQ